ncbi:MAG: hypothetical protein U0Z26_03165 [Anaerolineales bacterium]
MATIHNLSSTLNSWIRRLRVQHAVTWALRGLLLGLGIGLIAGLVGLFQFHLLRNEFLTLVSAIALLTPIIASGIAFFWPVNQLQAARYFDRTFHLGERVSTALELNQTHSKNEFTSQQLEDALSISRKVKPNRDLPIRLRKREIIYTAIVAVLIGVVWFQGETWFEAARKARAVQQAVQEQAANIEEMIQKIQANDKLTPEQQQQLTAPLEQALQQLQQNPSLENSVSVLTSTSQQLQTMSNDQAQQTAQALQQAGGELAKQDGSPLQGVGDALAKGDTVSAASQLANMDLSKMDASQANQTAQQLDTLAKALQSSNPQLASQLQNAADALRRGDIAAAQQALNHAATQMAQAGQQIAASQTASQTAQQLQQGAGQVVAAGGGQQQAANGQGQNGQGQNGQGQNGNGTGSQMNGAGTSGSGSGSGAQNNQPGNEAGNNPINQNNGASDGGEKPYEQIYAPSLLGGDNGTTVNLPTSGQEGEVIGQGPTDPSKPGESLVPYDQVYSQYNDFNRQAIESGNVPVEFMSVIRNYFDSLQP